MTEKWHNISSDEALMALDREPWNREYLRSLGTAIFNAGDKKTGLQYLHEVAPLYPDNSGMLAELATAYMAMGDIENARLYAEKAIATRPDDIMALAVLKKTYVLGSGPGNVTTS